MDIAENGINAGATCIQIDIVESIKDNLLKISIADNGRGIPQDMLDKVTDPFVTSRTTRRVGLGLSLLKDAAIRCDGSFDISSKPGKGTKVVASFQHDHIDRAPLGDIAGSVGILLMGNPGVDFIFKQTKNEKEFEFDTRQVRQEMEDIDIHNPAVVKYLIDSMQEHLEKLGS